MRIDIVDFIRIHTAIFERVQHAATRTIHARRSNMVGISAHAHAGQLAVDACPACRGVLERFQHQNTGTLAQHEAITILVPWSAGSFWRIIALGKRLDGTKSADTREANGRFRTTRDHNVGVAIFNKARGIADAMRRGSTCRYHRYVWTLEAVENGYHPCDHVHDRTRHKKWRNPPRTFRNHFANIFLDHRQATDA